MSANPERIRHNWHLDEVLALFAMPFSDLIYQAQTVHRQHTLIRMRYKSAAY